MAPFSLNDDQKSIGKMVKNFGISWPINYDKTFALLGQS